MSDPVNVRGQRTSATSPDSGRAKNTYVREDQIMPHLAAIGILLEGHISGPGCGKRSPGRVTGPTDTAALIDQLHVGGVVLTYDPDGRILRVGDDDVPSVTIGKYH